MDTQKFLKGTDLFSQLDDAALNELTGVLRARCLAAGEILFHKGDPGDELILVQSGRLAIFAGADNAQAVRVFGPGQVLGEMALIDRKPRSMSARAEQASDILTLTGDDFRRLLAEKPLAAQAVMAGLSERIRYTSNFLEEVRVWVKRMVEGNYQSATHAEGPAYSDPTLAALAQEFARMATVVREREELLRREVTQLRIEIDQAKRKQEAERIMGSEYYQQLKEKAKALRRSNENE